MAGRRGELLCLLSNRRYWVSEADARREPKPMTRGTLAASSVGGRFGGPPRSREKSFVTAAAATGRQAYLYAILSGTAISMAGFWNGADKGATSPVGGSRPVPKRPL